MKMIEVTAQSDRTPIFINIDKIEAIFINDEEEDNTTVIETENSSYCCEESPKEVYQKIKAAENE